jgi:hypothetical protein
MYTAYTTDELLSMYNDLQEKSTRDTTSLRHCRDVIQLYINDLNDIEMFAIVEDDTDENSVVYRLRKRAEIRRQIQTRKSVQEGEPDRISDLLEEAANELEARAATINAIYKIVRSE